VHPQNETYSGNVDPVGPRAVYDEAKRFAEALTITGQKVTDELFGRVRAHYSEAETVELAAAVALIDAHGAAALGRALFNANEFLFLP